MRARPKHLSILMETMRREGYGIRRIHPSGLTKEIDGKICEPIERLVCDVPDGTMGAVIEKIGQRKAISSPCPRGQPVPAGNSLALPGSVRLPERVPHRHPGRASCPPVLDSYAPMKGEITRRLTGSLVSFGPAKPTPESVQRPGAGRSLHRPRYRGLRRYGGSICSRNEDMTVNVCRRSS